MSIYELGEIKPVRGRWSWPHADMKAGEYFRVSQFARPKGQVANMSYVRGNQLNKRFSVGDDPDHPGFTRVTCTADDVQTVVNKMKLAQLRPGKTHFSYEEAMRLMIEPFYVPGQVAEIAKMMWGSLINPGETDRETAHWRVKPQLDAFTTDSFGEGVVLVELRPSEVRMSFQPKDFELEAWQKSKLLDD